MPNPGECCYKILQVTKFSTDKEIKASFLKLAKLHHPDLNRLNRQDHKQDSKEFRRIHEAYMTLKDANLRRIYDTNIAHEESLRSQYPYHTASSTYTSAGMP
jgi:DnaJ-class molecular chaperone